MKKAADFKVEADIERSRRASLQILKRRMSNLVLQTQISTAGIQQSPTLKIGARSPSISHDQELPYSPNIRKQPSQSISSFSESPSPARKNPQKSPTKIREGKSSKGNETSKSFLDIIEKDGNKSALDIYSYYGVSVHDKENKSVLESRTPLTQLEKVRKGNLLSE